MTDIKREGLLREELRSAPVVEEHTLNYEYGLARGLANWTLQVRELFAGKMIYLIFVSYKVNETWHDIIAHESDNEALARLIFAAPKLAYSCDQAFDSLLRHARQTAQTQGSQFIDLTILACVAESLATSRPLVINVASDFSDTPGGRFEHEGPHSAQEFYRQLLLPQYTIARREGRRVTVNLDGVAGYAASFLDQSFGQLAREFGRDEVFNHLTLTGTEEDYLIGDIQKIINTVERRYSAEGLTYEKALELIQTLESFPDNIIANITAGGVAITCTEDQEPHVREICKTFGTDLRLGLTSHQESVILKGEGHLPGVVGHKEAIELVKEFSDRGEKSCGEN